MRGSATTTRLQAPWNTPLLLIIRPTDARMLVLCNGRHNRFDLIEATAEEGRCGRELSRRQAGKPKQESGPGRPLLIVMMNGIEAELQLLRAREQAFKQSVGQVTKPNDQVHAACRPGDMNAIPQMAR